MQGEVFTQFERPEKQYVPVSSESKTEQGGYVPMKEQVERFIRAGELLAQFRGAQYDAVDEKGELTLEDFVPLPMGADVVEVQARLDAANARMKAARKAKADADLKVAEEHRKKEAEMAREAMKAEVLAEINAGK